MIVTKYTMRMSFLWDDGEDIDIFNLVVPDHVSKMEIENILNKEHHFLCLEDEEDRYGIEGRCPETLLEYVCEKYDWKYEGLKFHIDMEFD